MKPMKIKMKNQYKFHKKLPLSIFKFKFNF